MRQNRKQSKKSKNIIITILLLLFLSVSLYAGYLYWQSLHPESQYAAKVNKITEINKEEQQEYLNQLVEDGMMNVRYSTGSVFNGKISESFSVKNSPNNQYPIVFKLYGEDGSLLYESKKIKPGYEMNSIELNKELKKGSYAGNIVIGYAEEGNVSSKFPINITVK